MTEQEKKELKEKLQEEKQYRKLQKAIASLPQPSFNNPEKVQPAKQVSVPTVIPASMKGKGASVSPDVKSTKIVDIPDILDTNTTRIEKVAKIRRNKKQSVILRALSYMKKEWFLLVLAIFFCFANSIFECLIPLIIGDGIDFIVGPNEVNFAMVSKYIIYLSLCIVGFAVFKWLTSRVANGLSYRVEQKLHNEIFKKFNKVPLKYIDNSSHGDLQSRMINDVDLITDGFVIGLTTFFDCLATIIFTLIFMFRINVTISIIIICITPASIVVATVIAKLSHNLFRKQAKNVGDLSGTLVEMVGNQKIVKGFMYENRSIEKFDDINKKLRDVSEKANYYSSLSAPITRFINGLLYAMVAILGCVYAIRGAMSIGNISVFLSFANKYTRPFNDIADVFSDLQAAYASAVRVFNVLDMQNEVSDEDLPNLKKCSGSVTFKHVDFSYTPEKN